MDTAKAPSTEDRAFIVFQSPYGVRGGSDLSNVLSILTELGEFQSPYGVRGRSDLVMSAHP